MFYSYKTKPSILTRLIKSLIIFGLFLSGYLIFFNFLPAQAAASFVQSNSLATKNTSSIAVTFSAASSNNLLIVFCGTSASRTISGPSGFTQIQNNSGTPAQASYYKVAVGGENSVSCSWSGGNDEGGIIVIEYNGLATASPLAASATASGSGDTTAECPSVNPGTDNYLYISGLTFNANSSISSWSNSFVEREDVNTSGGSPSSRIHHAAADRLVASSAQSTTATAGASGAWTCHTAAFNEAIAGTLSVDIVDADSSSVASPSVSMASANYDYAYQVTTGTLGTAAEKIRVDNGSATASWTLTIAASSGSSATWSDGGSNTYDFNDPTINAQDGPDADAVGGLLTIDSSVGTITPQSGCSSTGVSLGSATAFSEGVIDSITLLSASGSAETSCYWDLTSVSLSQDIPASQVTGTYTIDLTLTVS